MRQIASLAAMLLGTVSCTTNDAVPEANVERISFSVEPCFGFCPDFALTVDANGRGTFDGQNFVAAPGVHVFSANPEQLAAFQARLAPFRPAESVAYDYENCDGAVMTDMPSVAVTWHGDGGEDTELRWYMGCRQPGLSDRSDEIYRAWEELPIGDLVGSDEDRRSFGPS